MVYESKYVVISSRASAALSPIGLCRVVLRVGSRAETVTISIKLITQLRRFEANLFIFFLKNYRFETNLNIFKNEAKSNKNTKRNLF